MIPILPLFSEAAMIREQAAALSGLDAATGGVQEGKGKSSEKTQAVLMLKRKKKLSNHLSDI